MMNIPGLLGFLWLFLPALAMGVSLPVSNPSPGAPALRQTVAALAENDRRPAGDFATMAEQTISFGSDPESLARLKNEALDSADPHRAWRSMIQDALAGVDEGERRDPRGADWADLRERLKRLQPPPPPPSTGSGKDKKNQQKEKNQAKKGNQNQPQPSGSGQKPKPAESGEGQEGEGAPGSSPSPGQSAKGDKKNGQSGGEKDPGQKTEGEDRDQVRDFNSSKEGEGQMKERERNEAMKGFQDEKAGFGRFGQEKKEKDEAKGAAKGSEGEKAAEEMAPPGMRVVGGGSGQKAGDKKADPLTLEALSRLDQVRQSDSPAILQQRLQPQDQRPQSSSAGKPW